MRGFLGRVLARRMVTLATTVVGVLLLALPPAANARKLQMSGTWAVRNGGVFIPLQFAELTMYFGPTSLGNLSKGFGYPNGPIRGGGVITATGSAPEALRVPRHRFVMQPTAAIALAGSTLVQVTTMFEIDGPFETATLAPGGGPGSFTWCPNDVLGCPATGPPKGGQRAGRILYQAGANQFGGSLRIGLAIGGVNSFQFRRTPFQVGHVAWGATGPTPRAAIVGAGTPSMPATGMFYLAPGVVTQPTMTPTPDGLVLYPGPKLTTMLGLTTTGTGPIFRLPGIGTSAQGMSIGQSTTQLGFAHTTGTVFVQMSTGSYTHTFFTVMGYDERTALGAGNIALVAGGLSFRNTQLGQRPYATFHKVWLSLAPPVPSLSPSGVAAAGALLLLAAGYALRRRVRL